MANGTTIVPFKEGDIIKDRFTLIKQIGAGTYGAIFAALYQEIGQISKLVAIKFEKEMVKRTLLQNEIIIMRKMDEQLHRTGFVHRDIKPDNFAIGNIQETAGTIYLLDFGLCKRLCIQDGKVIKPSQPGNFRGTLRYASINAHCKIELGRQDDLISLLYMMVEYFTKKLPWSNVTNPDQILQLKEQSRGGFFLLNMPVEFLEFEKYIFSLDYVDEPDYAYLTSLMYSAAQRNGVDLNEPFEWEEELQQQREITHNNYISNLEQMNPNQSNRNDTKENTLDVDYKDDIIIQNKIQPIANLSIQDQMIFELTNINLIEQIQANNLKLFKQSKVILNQENNYNNFHQNEQQMDTHQQKLIGINNQIKSQIKDSHSQNQLKQKNLYNINFQEKFQLFKQFPIRIPKKQNLFNQQLNENNFEDIQVHKQQNGIIIDENQISDFKSDLNNLFNNHQLKQPKEQVKVVQINEISDILKQSNHQNMDEIQNTEDLELKDEHNKQNDKSFLNKNSKRSVSESNIPKLRDEQQQKITFKLTDSSNINNTNMKNVDILNNIQQNQHHQNLISKSPLHISENEQIPTEEQQLMMQHAFPIQSYTINTQQSAQFTDINQTQEGISLMKQQQPQELEQQQHMSNGIIVRSGVSIEQDPIYIMNEITDELNKQSSLTSNKSHNNLKQFTQQSQTQLLSSNQSDKNLIISPIYKNQSISSNLSFHDSISKFNFTFHPNTQILDQIFITPKIQQNNCSEIDNQNSLSKYEDKSQCFGNEIGLQQAYSDNIIKEIQSLNNETEKKENASKQNEQQERNGMKIVFQQYSPINQETKSNIKTLSTQLKQPFSSVSPFAPQTQTSIQQHQQSFINDKRGDISPTSSLTPTSVIHMNNNTNQIIDHSLDIDDDSDKMNIIQSLTVPFLIKYEQDNLQHQQQNKIHSVTPISFTHSYQQNEISLSSSPDANVQMYTNLHKPIPIIYQSDLYDSSHNQQDLYSSNQQSISQQQGKYLQQGKDNENPENKEQNKNIDQLTSTCSQSIISPINTIDQVEPGRNLQHSPKTTQSIKVNYGEVEEQLISEGIIIDMENIPELQSQLKDNNNRINSLDIHNLNSNIGNINSTKQSCCYIL